MPLFKPTLFFDRVTGITPQALFGLGVKGMALDIDNTLAVSDHPEPLPGVMDWLRGMRQAGFEMRLVSNNFPRRVAPFAERLQMDYTCLALKPLPFGFMKAASEMGLKCRQVAAIGDQLFTDMMGANLCGMKTVLVRPVHLETSFSFRVRRKLETKLLQNYRGTQEE